MGSDSVNKAYNQVKKFHKACGIEMPKTPTFLEVDRETQLFFKEDISAISDRMKLYSKNEGGSPLGDRISYMLEEIAELAGADTIEDQADALTDLIYFAIGTFTLIGVTPEEIFGIVAEANLGKIMPDGTVLRDEQGKIKKPEGWKEKFAPEEKIKNEIEIQRLYSY